VRFLGPRGDVLVTAGADGRAVLTDRRLGGAVAAAEAGAPLTALDARADGGCLAVGSAGGRAAAQRTQGLWFGQSTGMSVPACWARTPCGLSHVQAGDELWCVCVRVPPLNQHTHTCTHCDCMPLGRPPAGTIGVSAARSQCRPALRRRRGAAV